MVGCYTVAEASYNRLVLSPPSILYSRPAKARNSAIHEGRMPMLLENLSGGSGGRDSSRQRKERSPVSDFTRRIALKKQSEGGTGRNVVSYIVHP